MKCDGHLALEKRNSCCERWKKWHNLKTEGKLDENLNFYVKIGKSTSPTKHQIILNMLEYWATPEIIAFFKGNSNLLPEIGEWPNQESSSKL